MLEEGTLSWKKIILFKKRALSFSESLIMKHYAKCLFLQNSFFPRKVGQKRFLFHIWQPVFIILFLLKRFLCQDSTMMAFLFRHEIFSFLTLSRRRPLPYRNQSIDNGLRLERVNGTYILNKFGKVSLKIFKPYNSLLSLSKSKFIKSV